MPLFSRLVVLALEALKALAIGPNTQTMPSAVWQILKRSLVLMDIVDREMASQCPDMVISVSFDLLISFYVGNQKRNRFLTDFGSSSSAVHRRSMRESYANHTERSVRPG